MKMGPYVVNTGTFIAFSILKNDNCNRYVQLNVHLIISSELKYREKNKWLKVNSNSASKIKTKKLSQDSFSDFRAFKQI